MPAEKRRELIIDSAREVFLASGYGGARTRDIASGAGINEAVLYQHFDSKEHLFNVAILEPLSEGIDAMVEEIVSTFDASDPLERVETFENIFRIESAWMAMILPLLGVALFSGEAAGQEVYRARVYRKLSESQLAQLPERFGWDEFPIGLSTMLTIFVSMSTGLVLDDMFGSVAVDWERASSQLSELVTKGLDEAQLAPTGSARRSQR